MRGFSLLETIVAIAILILAILGPLSVATYTLSRASLSENEVVAYNLAEEALEFVINTRDSNIFRTGDPNDWLDGLVEPTNNCDDENQGCYIDVTDTSDPIKPCSSSCNNTFVRRNSTSGLYNHQAASGDNVNTIFRRRVLLLDDNDLDVDLENNDERVVRVIVTWNERFLPNKSFTIEHHIYERE